MKKLIYLIVLALILGLVLTGCSLLSNVGQVPATDQSDITYLTKNPGPVLAARWNFDEGSGQTAGDTTGVNDGQLGSTTGVDANDPSWVVSPFGFGNALSFDGNDYVIVPDNDTLDITGEIIIEAWIQPTAVDGYRTIVSKRSGKFANYALRLDGKKVEFYYRKVGGGTWSEWRTNVDVVAVNNKYHIVVTYKFGVGDSIIVYVNDTSYGGSWIFGVSEDVTADTFPVHIGYNYPGWSQPFKGIIDEVSIWIVKPTPVITWSNPADIIYGTALNGTQLNATASVAGTFVYTPPVGTVLSAGSDQTLHMDFTPTDTANYDNASKDVPINVLYAYSGILQPINADGSSIFKLGRTVPVKFQLQDTSGAFVADAVARIYLLKISDDLDGTEEEDAVSTSAATTGNLFRYDFTSDQYIFNLATKSLSVGTWKIRIELDDGTSKFVNISLR